MNDLAHRNPRNPWLAGMLILAIGPALAQDEESPQADVEEVVEVLEKEFECPEADDGEELEDANERCLKLERVEVDDTADIDTDSTIDTGGTEKGLVFSGDFRPLLNYVDRINRSDEELTETVARARIRFKGSARLSNLIGVGARIAGRCSSDECDLEWVNDRSTPQQNGVDFGQFTFDEFYIHLFQDNRFDLTVGRQQTRMVLRGGVFSRSLDRNNSNNTNVTWTDGLHFALRERRGWDTHIIVDHNAADGSGSVRRGQLDFSPDSARTSYFASTENRSPVGAIVQRSFSVTYLPNALMVDGDIDGRRDSYIGYVGRLAIRWPMQTDGPFFRGGFEVGYAPNVPTPEGANLATSVDGVAWNVTASIMDFKPRHNIGIFYSHTGAGWLLSPNFAQNERGFEVRYQWRPRNRPALDFRVRWREDLEQPTTAVRKRERFDAFLRLTWQFDMK
jgi:hypothetical protein